MYFHKIDLHQREFVWKDDVDRDAIELAFKKDRQTKRMDSELYPRFSSMEASIILKDIICSFFVQYIIYLS